MTGLEIIRAPGTTAEQIADIIAEHCPPITPEHCDKLSCRGCWLAWRRRSPHNSRRGGTAVQDAYITLEEAAAFEGIKYKTLAQRIARSPDQYDTKAQAREGGGKDQVLLSVASLTAKARKAWRATQKVDGRDVIIDRRAMEAAPWYVTADLNHYIDGHKKAYYEAVEAARVVQEFIDYAGPEKRTDLAARLAVGLGVSPQSFYRYQTQVLEANAWALKLEREDGQCRDYFRALALCRKPKAADTFPSLTPEQRALIENIWFDSQFAANLGTREMLYEKFEAIARERGWADYPSTKTVGRYINYLMSTRGAASALCLAADGEREWRNKMQLKGKRDATTLEVMEPIPIVSEDTAAHGIEKVIFKKLTHKGENRKAQLTVNLELWEYIPQTIMAASSTDGSGQASGGGGTQAAAASNDLNEDYRRYLGTKRGKSPAVDDAGANEALNRVSQMPY